MPSKTNTSKKNLVGKDSSVGKSLEEKSVKEKSMEEENTKENKWRELTIPEKRRLGTWR